jgi:hypothetical protein
MKVLIFREMSKWLCGKGVGYKWSVVTHRDVAAETEALSLINHISSFYSVYQ